MKKDKMQKLQAKQNQYTDLNYYKDETAYDDEEKWLQIKKRNKRNKSKPTHKKWDD